jgi:hypothetical protein
MAPDGGTIVASVDGSMVTTLTRLDRGGAVMWSRTVDGGGPVYDIVVVPWGFAIVGASAAALGPDAEPLWKVPMVAYGGAAAADGRLLLWRQGYGDREFRVVNPDGTTAVSVQLASGSESYHYVSGVAAMSDGGFAVVGWRDSGTDVWRLEADGQIRWAQRLDGVLADAVRETDMGGVDVLDDYGRVELNADGAPVWSRTSPARVCERGGRAHRGRLGDGLALVHEGRPPLRRT